MIDSTAEVLLLQRLYKLRGLHFSEQHRVQEDAIQNYLIGIITQLQQETPRYERRAAAETGLRREYLYQRCELYKAALAAAIQARQERGEVMQAWAAVEASLVEATPWSIQLSQRKILKKRYEQAVWRAGIYILAVEDAVRGTRLHDPYTTVNIGPSVCQSCNEIVRWATTPGCCYCDDCQRPRMFRHANHTTPAGRQYIADTQYHGGRWYDGEW